MATTKKQPPQPVMNRRLLLLATLLVALAVGIVVGVFIPAGVSGFVVGLLLLVAGAVFFVTWDTWRKEYQVWISRPVRMKRSSSKQQEVTQ
jgi:hypothetical protein